MEKLQSNRLKVGDKIGVVAPSNRYKEKNKSLFEEATKLFNKMGLEVVPSKNLYKIDGGTPKERAEDINAMFADDKISAIICLEGGDTANGVLPFLDYDIIKNNPKIFMGYSDITVILNAIYKKTGLVTYHGNDFLYGFGDNPTDYDIAQFEKFILNAEIGQIDSYGERKKVRKGAAEGIALGGNIRCLLKLAGTEYFPDMENSILFLEANSITSSACDYSFEQLKQMGVFNKVNGVVIGYIKGLQKDNENKIQMEDILLKVTKEYNFPILKCNDFGHFNVNTVIPIGAKVRIKTSDLRIEILERSLK